MSFGFSVGDVVLLVQLAHKTFRNCQKAGEEYNEIAHEIRSLHSVLSTLRSEAQRPDSKVFKQDPSSTKELIATADGCKNILDTLDVILVKYEGLKANNEAGAAKKLWQKLSFGSKTEELNVIRSKLITYTSTISVLLDTMQIKVADRLETKIDDGFTEMAGQFEKMRKEIYKMASQARAAERNGSTLSLLSLSTYNGDDKEVWQDFRRELIKKGFRSQSLDRHRAVLQAYMLKLDQSGVLDQAQFLKTNQAEGTPWWTRRMHMETLSSLDNPTLHNTPSPRIYTPPSSNTPYHRYRRPDAVDSAPMSKVEEPVPRVQGNAPVSKATRRFPEAWMTGTRVPIQKENQIYPHTQVASTEHVQVEHETRDFRDNQSLLTPTSTSTSKAITTSQDTLNENQGVIAPSGVSTVIPSKGLPSREANISEYLPVSDVESGALVAELLGAKNPHKTDSTPHPTSQGNRDEVMSFANEPEIIGVSQYPLDEEFTEPRKCILRPPAPHPTYAYPILEDIVTREASVPSPDVPPNASWTKILRTLIDPKALELGKESFQVKDDFVIVRRVLSIQELEGYTLATKRIRAYRHKRRSNADASSREHTPSRSPFSDSLHRYEDSQSASDDLDEQEPPTPLTDTPSKSMLNAIDLTADGLKKERKSRTSGTPSKSSEQKMIYLGEVAENKRKQVRQVILTEQIPESTKTSTTASKSIASLLGLWLPYG